MYRAIVLGSLIAAAVAAPAVAGGRDHVEHFRANLVGFNEIPSILSEATGTVDLWLNRDEMTLTYKVTFSGLTSPTTQSHIHFGKIHTNGTPIVYFCTNLAPPAGVPVPPPCPNSGTVTGVLTMADVIGIPAQNVTKGDFDAVEDALNSDTAYANVHTQNFQGGEIRGQIFRDFF